MSMAESNETAFGMRTKKGMFRTGKYLIIS
jgi:hypothetical protein